MPLAFDGNSILGSTESIITTSPDLPMRRVTYWDVRGEGEIVGRPTGRSIIITHILHGEFQDYQDLSHALEDLDDLVGTHGTLNHSAEVHGDVTDNTYRNVTFERWEPIALPGQEHPCPLKDIGSTLLDDNGDADEGWFQYLKLYFRQLNTGAEGGGGR